MLLVTTISKKETIDYWILTYHRRSGWALSQSHLKGEEDRLLVTVVLK